MADGFWAVAVLLTSVLAAEVRLLRWAVWAYGAQVVIMAAVQFGMGHEAVPVLVALFQGLILTGLLWWYGRGEEAAGPAFGPSVLAAALLGMGALYAASRYDAGLLTLAAGMGAVGIWTLLAHRDPFKLAMGICLAENGVHALLVSLMPHLPVTTELGLAAAAIGVVWLLLFTGRRLKEVGA